MDKTRLEEFNPWWLNGKVDPELALPYKRTIFIRIDSFISKRFILALVGLRRVGKTTIIYQLIQELLQRGTKPENIVFFSFDEIAVKINDVMEGYNEIHKKDFRDEKVYFFFDEIQKCKGWEDELKRYYDLYPKLKFIISGSESLFIKKKNKESLAGRIFEFELNPFSFKEFLSINRIKESEFKYEKRILPLFIEYIERGGFPEAIGLESEKDFNEYLTALLVDKIIYKDIPQIFKIEDPQFLIVLLEAISSNPGMFIDYLSLSKQFGKDRRVIRDYLIYLSESFLIRIIGNYRKSNVSSLRKLKKAYPRDNALSYLYKHIRDESFFGKMVETAVVNKLEASMFWKNGIEVDIIQKGFPVEVKYQETLAPEDHNPMRKFMKKFGVKEGTIITKKNEGVLEVEEGRITLIPAWKFLLEP